nr:proliferating cell nuclear antigen (pcna) [uncultured Methanobacterium sp.]
MFKLVLDDSNILKTSFKAISSIVDEVRIHADDEGLKIDALDKSHTTFIHLKLKIGLFDEYLCDAPVNINVETEELMKVLKRSVADDIVELGVDEDNLILSFIGEAERIFKIHLIDMEYTAPSPPEMRYPTEFEVPFDLLKNSIKDIDIVSDKIQLQVDDKKFIASAEGELSDAQIRYHHGEKIFGSVKSVFSLAKIKETLKADKFSDSALIKLGDDMPLNLTLKTVMGDGLLNFMIAPRIESEE